MIDWTSLRCKRDKLKRSTRQGTEMTVAPRLHKRLQRLQSQARGRRCSLKILPPHFSRRKENTSCYDFQDRVSTGEKIFLKFIIYQYSGYKVARSAQVPEYQQEDDLAGSERENQTVESAQ